MSAVTSGGINALKQQLESALNEPVPSVEKIKRIARTLASDVEYASLLPSDHENYFRLEPKAKRDIRLVLVRADIVAGQVNHEKLLNEFTTFGANLSSNMKRQTLNTLYQQGRPTRESLLEHLSKLECLKASFPDVYTDIHQHLTNLLAEFDNKCRVVLFSNQLHGLYDEVQNVKGSDDRAVDAFVEKFNTAKVKFENLKSYYPENGEYSRLAFVDRFSAICTILVRKTNMDEIITPPSRRDPISAPPALAPRSAVAQPPVVAQPSVLPPPSAAQNLRRVSAAVTRNLEKARGEVDRLLRLRQELANPSNSEARLNQVKISVNESEGNVKAFLDSTLIPDYINRLSEQIVRLEAIQVQLKNVNVTRAELVQIKDDLSDCKLMVKGVLTEVISLGNVYRGDQINKMLPQRSKAEQLVLDITSKIASRETTLTLSDSCESCTGCMARTAGKVYSCISNQYCSDLKGHFRFIIDGALAVVLRSYWGQDAYISYPHLALGAGVLGCRLLNDRGIRQSHAAAVPAQPVVPPAQQQPADPAAAAPVLPSVVPRPLPVGEPEPLSVVQHPEGQRQAVPFFVPESGGVRREPGILGDSIVVQQPGDQSPELHSSEQPGADGGIPMMQISRPAPRLVEDEEKHAEVASTENRSSIRRRAVVAPHRRKQIGLLSTRRHADLFGSDLAKGTRELFDLDKPKHD